MAGLIASSEIDDFLRGVSNLPLLTESEEAELARRGDEAAKNELWLRNLRWAAKLAAIHHRRYGPHFPGYTLGDALSTASLALRDSIDSFDPSLGRITTYSRWRIARYLERDCLNSTLIRFPYHVWTDSRKAYRQASPALSPRERQSCDVTSRLAAGVSIRGDFAVEDEPYEDADEVSVFTRMIPDLLDGLTPTQRDVIERRFGLFGRERETLVEIAESKKCSKTAVYLTQLRALNRLRELAARRGLVA